MKSLKSFLSLISGFALLAFLYQLFKSHKTGTSFPKASEKAAAEKDVAEIKEEIKQLDEKVYSDEEILKKFQ